jgi:hypothetical protein
VGGVVINLLPEILGSAIVPVWLIINIILLMGQNGLLRSAAFIVGATLIRLIQGALFSSVLDASTTSGTTSSRPGVPSLVTSTLLVVIGLLFVITGIKAYLKHPDPDDPPPKWMSTVSSLTPIKVLLLGAGWVLLSAKLWAFTLSAVSKIRDAHLGTSDSVITYLIYIVGCLLLFLISLLMYVVAPEWTRETLTRLRAWMEKGNRHISIVVSAVLAVLFLFLGIKGLIS